ncbi:hypothetical protein LKL81_26125 [Bacillus paranthracis]|uniref:hypothetical protein n=1 Tax=Bacillus paranthracis TaxID=2026186 RepID=UPI001E39BB18|nr:hypothetical protein [Bacillus paranthracis]MCC2430692.1 hypothetical protein [Bacillus paranthracis]
MEKANWSSKEVRNAYMRQWRAKNKDKVKQYHETYWEKKAKEMGEQGCKSLMQ